MSSVLSLILYVMGFSLSSKFSVKEMHFGGDRPEASPSFIHSLIQFLLNACDAPDAGEDSAEQNYFQLLPSWASSFVEGES